MKIEINKYQNLYMKVVYSIVSNGYILGVVNEVQIKTYPFHEGFMIRSTDGYSIFDDIHCRNMFEAKTEFRKLVTKYNKGK